MYKRRGTTMRKGPYRSSSSRTGYSQYVAPAAVGTRVVTKTPALRKAPGSNFAMQNRELAFSVVAQPSSPTYSVVAFPVQPGLQSIFPLLSNTAKSFTRYKMRFCIDFVSAVSTSSQGNILIAIDRNMDESPPTSVSELMTYTGAVSSNIWTHATYPANRSMVKQSEKILFTRYGSLGPNEDIKLYDMCNVFVALSGVAEDAGLIGQLYVTYECKFYDQRAKSVIQSNVFSYYPSVSDLNVTNIGEDSQLRLEYVVGEGEALFNPSVYMTDTGPSGTDTGATIIFPSAGYYLLLQDATVQITPGAATAPGTFTMDGWGTGYLMPGFAGSGVVTATASLPISFIWAPGSTDVGTCQTLQVVQVLVSGTYFLGNETVIGSGWISKNIGTSGWNGTDPEAVNSNEVEIFNRAHQPALSEFLAQSIEVTQIDAATAAYYFPEVFSSNDAGPLVELQAKNLRHHLNQAAIRGLSFKSRQTKKIIFPSMKRPIASSSTEVPEPEEYKLKKSQSQIAGMYGL